MHDVSVAREDGISRDNDSRAFDLIVIGDGPGGAAGAETALALGATVAVIERDRLGGT